MTEELLPIGRFAQLCRLSVKRLRHYDEVGLLAPARVDAVTGYRYYSRDQIRDALAIALLRDLDVALPAIGELLTGDDATRSRVLSAERARIAAEVARRQRTVQALERLLTEGLWRQEVTLAREPARRLLVAEAVTDAEGIGPAVGRCVAQVLTAGVGGTGPLWGVFPIDLDGPVRVAVGFETADAIAPGLVVERVPGGPAAVATHLGPYEYLPLTYQAVFAWIHERALRPRGPAFETYLTDPTTTPADQLVTRLVVPVGEEDR